MRGGCRCGWTCWRRLLPAPAGGPPTPPMPHTHTSAHPPPRPLCSQVWGPMYASITVAICLQDTVSGWLEREVRHLMQPQDVGLSAASSSGNHTQPPQSINPPYPCPGQVEASLFRGILRATMTVLGGLFGARAPQRSSLGQRLVGGRTPRLWGAGWQARQPPTCPAPTSPHPGRHPTCRLSCDAQWRAGAKPVLGGRLGGCICRPGGPAGARPLAEVRSSRPLLWFCRGLSSPVTRLAGAAS